MGFVATIENQMTGTHKFKIFMLDFLLGMN